MGVVFANCNLSVQCLRIMEISEDHNGEGPIRIKYMPKKSAPRLKPVWPKPGVLKCSAVLPMNASNFMVAMVI